MSFRHERRALHYIQRGEVLKLKSYLHRHKKLVLDHPLKDGKSLLQSACILREDACVLLLLRKGANPLNTDAAGNNALHLAAQEAEKGWKEAYSDLVVPLLKHCPKAMDAPNLQGTTPREILKRVENLLFDQPQHTPGRPSLFEPSSTDMSEWKWKLMSESMDEYQEMYGQYEDDFLGPAPEAETFEAWADRISQEYQARHCKSRHHYTEAQKDPIEANPKDLEVQKFKEREKQFAKEREHAQRECYRKRCDDVFGRLVTDKIDVHKKEINKDSKTVNTEKEEGNTSNSTRTHASLLGYSDIPWPVRGGTAEQMARYIAAGADSSNPSIYKRYLRAQQVTWHPDRFLQRCGSRLQAEDSKLILRTVTALSQELNRLAEQVK